MTQRSRIRYFVAGVLVVGLGLASRRYADRLPAILADYAGDTLWAAMVFVGIGFLAPRWPTWRVAAAALAVSYVTELSQRYHAPWIDDIRRTSAGGLVLGFGFLWSDIACYTVGVALSVMIEKLFAKRRDSSHE